VVPAATLDRRREAHQPAWRRSLPSSMDCQLADAVWGYDALATFRVSKSTLRFSAKIRPSTPSCWWIEWNSRALRRQLADGAVEVYIGDLPGTRVLAYSIIEGHRNPFCFDDLGLHDVT
jgi:hypothetical protein